MAEPEQTIAAPLDPEPEQREALADGGPSAEEVERQARDIGWSPKDRWRGDPEKWVDAGEFMKRSETYVPFLRHERQRMKTELEQRDQRLAQQARELQETKETLEGLKTFNETMAKERTDRRKGEIAGELRTAREAGDDVRVAELQAELGEVVKTPTPPAAKPPEQRQQQPVIQPWVKTFLDGNKEFFESARKVALFNAIMVERRQGGDTRVGEVEGTALLQEARDEAERALGGNARRQATSKTEESRPAGGNGARSGGKGYNDMPADARAQCDKQAAKFVGKPGFKDEAAWRRHFASEYFGPSARSFN